MTSGGRADSVSRSGERARGRGEREAQRLRRGRLRVCRVARRFGAQRRQTGMSPGTQVVRASRWARVQAVEAHRVAGAAEHRAVRVGAHTREGAAQRRRVRVQVRQVVRSART